MADIERTLTKTERNLWNAIIAEAMANLKYCAYAHKALSEGHPEVAQIFQEVAGAENIHGVNHLQVSGEIKSSLENLRGVIQGEAKEINAVYPRMVRDAVEEGRTDAAETFTMAMDRERHHVEVFSKALEELEAKLSSGDHTSDGEYSSTFSAAPQIVRRASVTEADVAPTYAAAREEVEGERWRITATGRIREVVFGAQDGLISTLAVVTAVAVSDLAVGNTIILVAGLAGALAGMLSMASGAYLGSKAQQDVQNAEIAKEAKELEEHPGEELAELIVLYQKEGLSFTEAKGVAEHIAADKDLWLRTLVEKELGLSPEITSNPIKDALTMGSAYMAAAIIPIFPYFFALGWQALTSSIIATLVGLFLLGLGKGRVVQKSPILQGLQILVIGAVAAGIGFVLGEIIPRAVT